MRFGALRKWESRVSTTEIVQSVLAGVVVLNLAVLSIGLVVTLGGIARRFEQLEAMMKALQEETTVTLQQATDTLARVETLSKSVDVVLKEQLAPTLQGLLMTARHAEAVAGALRGGADGLRGVIGVIENVARPAAAVAKNIGAPSTGRFGTAIAIGGALLNIFLATRSQPAPVPKDAEPAPSQAVAS